MISFVDQKDSKIDIGINVSEMIFKKIKCGGFWGQKWGGRV